MKIDASESPPHGARPDWTIDQGWECYGDSEHAVWTTLYERQRAMLPGRACDAFLRGLDALDLHRAAFQSSRASMKSSGD